MNTLITMAEVNEVIAKVLEHPVVVTLIALFTVIIAAIPTVMPYMFNRMGLKFERLDKSIDLKVNAFEKTTGKTLALIDEKISAVAEVPTKVAEIVEPIVDLTYSVAELVFLLIEGSRADDVVKEKARTVKAGLDTKIEGSYTAITRLNEETTSALKALHGDVQALKQHNKQHAEQESAKPKVVKKPRKSAW